MTSRMWTTLAIMVGLVGACLGAVGKDPDTPLEKNAWALLVAGSKGYMNYRHQADVCHSYHVMINEGIPAERIVVMMYDDIAHNARNPTPGVIINKPNGTNVYAGVKIDYKGDDVTAKNFLNILKGNKAALKGIGTGRVIESDDSTNVFVYIANEGGFGELDFPSSTLPSTDLHKTLSEMHEAKAYNKLIMYIDGSYSSSLFETILPEDTKVFAMTSTSRDQQTFGCYCDQICLGDEFSVRWMERMDGEHRGTLDQFFHQYQQLRPAVLHTNIQMYGDFSIGPDAMTPNKARSTTKIALDNTPSVNSRDIPLYYYQQRISNAKDPASKMKAQQDLDNLVEGRKIADEILEKLATLATNDAPHLKSAVMNKMLPLNLDMFPCYEKLLNNFRSHCFEHKHKYLLNHHHKFANMCLLGLDTSRLLNEMPSICAPYKAELKSTVL